MVRNARRMSYHCPKCNNLVYDRKSRTCGFCGAELPVMFLFYPPDLAATAKTEGIPIELLARTLLELKAVRGNPAATREAAVRYFKDGIADGIEIGLLLHSLLFWPDQHNSVFSQTGYSGNEGTEFVNMLKSLSVEELDSSDPRAE